MTGQRATALACWAGSAELPVGERPQGTRGLGKADGRASLGRTGERPAGIRAGFFMRSGNRIGGMADESPYQPPEHYSSRRTNEIPITAYLVAGGVLIAGISTTAFGFYYLLPRTALSGLFWIGIGLTGVFYIVTYRRKST